MHGFTNALYIFAKKKIDSNLTDTMQLSTDEFMKLQGTMTDKDIEIALLRKELEQLRSKMASAGDVAVGTSNITLHMDNVCKVLGELKGNVKLVSFLFLAIQKMMPEGIPMGVMKRMVEAASLEGFPVSIVAAGDLNVLGTYNNVHGNDNVAM